MVLTSAIVTSSVCLLSYWFRYACLLVIEKRTPGLDCVAEPSSGVNTIRFRLRKVLAVNIIHICEVAAAHELSFPEVDALLLGSANVDLDELCEALDQDYLLLNHLLNQAQEHLRATRCELFMLASDYHLLKAWYRVKRFLSLESASDALEEMTWVVWHFAERVAVL